MRQALEPNPTHPRNRHRQPAHRHPRPPPPPTPQPPPSPPPRPPPAPIPELARSPQPNHLPDELALAGEATNQVRAFLRSKGVGHWGVYCCNTNDLSDVEEHLAALGESDAAWEPHPSTLNGG